MQVPTLPGYISICIFQCKCFVLSSVIDFTVDIFHIKFRFSETFTVINAVARNFID